MLGHLAGGRYLHVDERRGGRLAPDLALTSSPVLVALVQTASTLPVFLLGRPAVRWPTYLTGAVLHGHAVLGGGRGRGAVR